MVLRPLRWLDQREGGHFTAREQLQLFSKELRAAFRPPRDWAKMAVPAERGGGHGR
jgi:hypothetical protein